jgi:hypothetical protein
MKTKKFWDTKNSNKTSKKLTLHKRNLLWLKQRQQVVHIQTWWTTQQQQKEEVR